MVMGDVPVEVQPAAVGGGPGEYAAAFHSADFGMKVAVLTEEPRLGWVRLLRGCVPSKTLLSVADLLHAARKAQVKGVRFQEPEIDLEKVRTWKDMVAERLTSRLAHLVHRRSIRVIEGRARFTSSGELHVHGKEEAVLEE